ncbi:MAG: hypothetical protein DRG27_06265 [Deltaproteobacteria bacterium]|nr:MAG: hypothetical protein DRG27_06265 [Deltaproteobacteria bacterium]
MIAISFVSKWWKLKRRIKCEFIEGHKWIVLMSPESQDGSYDVLIECEKCGLKRWLKSNDRISRGSVVEEREIKKYNSLD